MPRQGRAPRLQAWLALNEWFKTASPVDRVLARGRRSPKPLCRLARRGALIRARPCRLASVEGRHACQEHLDHPSSVVAVVPLGPDTEVPDGAHELEGPHVVANPPGVDLRVE